MDPRGAAAARLSARVTTPLHQLAQEAGADFPHLFAARDLTLTRLVERRSRLRELDHDGDVAIVLMGSWGRSEVTSGSDDDYMVLVGGEKREAVRPATVDIETVLDRAPGKQNIFGEPVWVRELIEKIGLDRIPTPISAAACCSCSSRSMRPTRS